MAVDWAVTKHLKWPLNSLIGGALLGDVPGVGLRNCPFTEVLSKLPQRCLVCFLSGSMTTSAVNMSMWAKQGGGSIQLGG